LPRKDVAAAPEAAAAAAPLPAADLLNMLVSEKEESDVFSFMTTMELRREIFIPVREGEKEVTPNGPMVKDAIQTRVGMADKRHGSFIVLCSVATGRRLAMVVLVKGCGV
jgi:hypothetical protein